MYSEFGLPPRAAESHFRLGQAYQRLGELEESAQALERSLEMVGSGPEAQTAHSVLAEVYSALDQSKLAEEHRELADP